MSFENVSKYIDDTILHSSSFDNLEDSKKRIAVSQAESLLYLYYKAYKPERNPLPVEAIAYQTIWEIDKGGVRDSDMGIASQSIEGMTQTFRALDRTIAPEVKKILRNRVGRYHLPVSDTHRHVNRL